MHTYLSWVDWSKTTTGLEYASLVGNTAWIDEDIVIGTTTLPVSAATTVDLKKYDTITIFDGQNSEVVTVTAATSSGVTSIPISATVYAHVAGTPYCSDGTDGSLAVQIISASTYVETICRQSLFLNTYENEQLAMPSMRASIDNHYALHFRPRHWPIQSISDISITVLPSVATMYDPTQVVIDSDRQICAMPNIQPISSMMSSQTAYPIWNVQNRNTYAQLTITYQAGFSNIPADVIEAAVLLASDILAKRLNPYGAPELKSGQRQLIANIKSESTGQSLLFKRAKSILDYYTMQSF